MGLVHWNRQESRERLLAGDIPDWIKNSPRKRYITAAVLSFPPWVDRKALLEMQKEAARLTKETGVTHVLAHIVPLNHSFVCGLTVPWNLRIRTWRQNQAESNHFLPDQLPLFDQTE